MENAWKELQPKNIYQGRKSSPLKEEGKSALLSLYQPLIGGEALSLYLTLYSEISLETGTGPESLHADLLSSLSCGLPQFYEARKKLEGIGLLEVYFKNDESLGSCFLYELLEPMDVTAFFNDTLLSFLLLEKVGERRFSQLTKLFEPKNLSHEGYQKVTKKFLDVYRFNETVYAANQEQVESIQQRFTPSETKSLIEESSSFDWTFLTDWLKKQHINQLNEEVLQQVKMYQQLYGFDELTLGELILQSFDFTTAEVSLKELQRIVLVRQQQQRTSQQADSTLDPEEPPEMSTAVNQALPSAAQQLIQVARQTPPMRYLEAIKKEKGGYVSKQENWLLQDLVSQSGLSSGVINILINYVLVIKNHASLNASFVNTIANEWAQKKINTPEEAIEHLHTLKTKAKQPKTTKQNNSSNYRRNVRREKLPDWVNQPKDETQISTEKKAEIDRRFKEYLAKKEGES
ncbi:replication initiation and membrane attachment family protein [Candidatus Enterococcus mangumiae]|uniref:Replication initiation and membrane attachment protein n=1 Tax=Candidatus Enterococcus mangumiae TaxID=2230878 RepID=A0ABZ2T4T5_9ENTE|nr:DnaD domain protein [Enterococcus sp. DIV1094]MBO0490511.1 DnaD domain protein [Enterococcus sp. DIV1094]